MKNACFVFNRADVIDPNYPALSSHFYELLSHDNQLDSILRFTYPNVFAGELTGLLQFAISDLPLNFDFANSLQLGDVMDEPVLCNAFPVFEPNSELQVRLIKSLVKTGFVGIVSERRFGKIGSPYSEEPVKYGLVIYLTIVHKDHYLETRKELLCGQFHEELAYM